MWEEIGKALAHIVVDGIDFPVLAGVDFELRALECEVPVTMYPVEIPVQLHFTNVALS